MRTRRHPPTPMPAADPTTAAQERAGDRRAGALRLALLAAMAYVPLLLSDPGRVAADTKSYLYLDPGRLLERAPSMWDPNIGLGTVTHQNIGYLFPMGPWFWAFDVIGVPDWVAQRLWLGTIVLAAGAGMLFLLRSLGWTGAGASTAPGLAARLAAGGALAGAVAYMLSPFLLHYSARTTVILMPWAGLPWLLGLTQRALRTGSWRHPAAFAIVVALVGGVNATALLLVALAPLAWLPFAVWVHRDVTLGRALATAARLGVLTLGTSLWWIAGLATQGSYGIDVLAYTESVSTVATTSLSSEVLRGLGYWFFYGGDKVGRWNEAGILFVTEPWVIAASFCVPGFALIAAFVTRWRYRAFFALLAVGGTAVAVGAHPYDDPSPLGAAFKAAAESSSAGLAMRSLPRAVPLVALALAVLVASGVAAVGRSQPRLLAGATGLAVLVAGLGLAPLWTGDVIGDNVQRDEEIPAYWREATAYLDERGDGTRVLEVPGSDFAHYRWGATLDPLTPGLMDRPYVDRELIPYGSEASADLVIALDRQFQDRQLDPSVIAPMARLLGAGDVLLRSDLQWERYRLPKPQTTWRGFDPVPEGLEEPVAFGDPTPNLAVERLRGRDEADLANEGMPDPPPVAVFGVENPLPIVRAASADRPLLLAGDGDGVVEAAAAGLLDRRAPVFYAADLADDPVLRNNLMDAGADLVLTDSNRRRGRRWSTVYETTGFTEQDGEVPLVEDPTDNRLPLFEGAGDDTRTVVEHRGVRRVQASDYGNPNSYVPEVRPANALDGNLRTAWRVGDFSPVDGERLLVELDEPVATGSIEVVQPLTGYRNRSITRVEVLLDGESAGTFELTDASRSRRGQRLDLDDEQEFSTVELVVAGDTAGPQVRYGGLSPVGFAEVRIGDVRVDEVVRLPTEMLAAAGSQSAAHDLSVLLERARQDPVDPGRTDEELSMARTFDLPTERRFTLEGDARLSTVADEPLLDRLLGIPTAEEGGVTATSSSHVEGVVATRASSALDGDETTAWRPRFGGAYQEGAWLDVRVPSPVVVDRLDLSLLADGEHSVPTRLRVEGGGERRVVDLPAIEDGDPGATEDVTVDFEPLTTRRLRVTVEAVRPVTSIEYYSERPDLLPVGVAELGIPGVRREPMAEQVAGGCREDLLEVDGRPVGVRVTGTTAAAEGRGPLGLEVCGDGADALSLDDGGHLLRATPGLDTGLDLDRLALRSEAPGGTGRPVTAAPEVEVVDEGRTSFDLRVTGASEPFWLVLGQSHNLGWRASVDGNGDGGGDLGEPRIIDGFANGWYVDPEGGGELSVSLDWVPQRRVWAGLGISAAALVVCLVVAVVGWRRARSGPALVLADGTTGTANGPVVVELASPFSWGRRGRRPTAGRTAVTALVAGALAAILVSPLVGAGVVAATALAMSLERRGGRVLLAIGSVGAFAAAAGSVLVQQVVGAPPPRDFSWTSYMDAAHVLAWVALVLLAADVLVGLARGRR